MTGGSEQKWRERQARRRALLESAPPPSRRVVHARNVVARERGGLVIPLPGERGQARRVPLPDGEDRHWYDG